MKKLILFLSFFSPLAAGFSHQELALQFLSENHVVADQQQLEQNLKQFLGKFDQASQVVFLDFFHHFLSDKIERLQGANMTVSGQSTTSKVFWSGLGVLGSMVAAGWSNLQYQKHIADKIKIIDDYAEVVAISDSYRAKMKELIKQFRELKNKQEMIKFAKDHDAEKNSYSAEIAKAEEKLKEMYPALMAPIDSFYNNYTCACLGVAIVLSLYGLYAIAAKYHTVQPEEQDIQAEIDWYQTILDSVIAQQAKLQTNS